MLDDKISSGYYYWKIRFLINIIIIGAYWSTGGLDNLKKTNNKNKKNNNNQPPQGENIRVRSPRKGEIPGIVEQILGHGKLKVRCNDKNIRLCRIPGKMKKRIWIREGDVVLVKPWDFQSDEKADVIWRYTRTEANYLERRGFLKI